MIESEINFHGDNNILYCDKNVCLDRCVLSFFGNNSVIFLNSNKHPYKINVYAYNNSACYIGKNNYFNEAMNILLSEQKHVFFGNDSLFSLDVWMRIADPHLIYDAETKQRKNPSKSIFVGDHVWIGQSAFILKGSQIHSGSIIGAMSVVTGKKIPSNESWAGNPAKKRGENVFWGGLCVNTWTDEETEKYQVFETDAYTYKYSEEEYIAFDEIDEHLSTSRDAKGKFEYLMNFRDNGNKNRFAIN